MKDTHTSHTLKLGDEWQLVSSTRNIPNTLPVGDDYIEERDVVAAIQQHDVDAMALAAIYFNEPTYTFYDDYCNEKGYYNEARDFVRDIVWGRYYELLKTQP